MVRPGREASLCRRKTHGTRGLVRPDGFPTMAAMSKPPALRRFPWSRRRNGVFGLLALSLFLSSCAVMEIEDAPLSAVDPKGPFAQQIDDLFWWVFWIAVVVFVLVEGGLVYAVFKYRDRPGSPEPKQIHGNNKLEITWTLIPVLILAAISVPTVKSIFDLTECGSDAMTVNIIGHQWWFEYQYPDLGIETANVLVMPADQEVCALMTSEDVLHNFWIPNLNGKRYLIPGQETNLRLQADEPGEYWGQCAEFCGLSHALMRARAVALTDEDWDAWVAEQQAPATEPAQGTLAYDGLEIYQAQCASCHTVDYGSGSDFTSIRGVGEFQGPNLTHFASRNVFAGAHLPEEGISYDDALEAWLADPPSIKPGSFMPNLGLAQDDLDALTAWLATLK